MRLAFCLSGHMRTFEITAESQVRNIIRPNKADVFISTWDVIGFGKHDKWQEADFQAPLDRGRIEVLYGDYLKKLEVYNFNQVQTIFPKCFYTGMVSMYWQIYQADELRRAYERENGFRYDIVVRCRPDLLFHTGIEIEDPRQLGDVLWVRHPNEQYIDDQFALGCPRVLEIYSNLYNFLPQYHELHESMRPPQGYDCVCTPEQTLKYHLDQHGVRLMHLPLTLELYRGDHKY